MKPRLTHMTRSHYDALRAAHPHMSDPQASLAYSACRMYDRFGHTTMPLLPEEAVLLEPLLH